jgi:4-hydroxybenzoate polyprenyltransferase
MQEFSIKHRLFSSSLGPWLRLMRLDRPIGLVLLLWPTLWALFIAAGGWPDLKTLVIFVAGVGVMRSAGCVINDYFDRDIDPQVARTQSRPLATGELSPNQALGLFVALMAIALGLVAMTNPTTVALALVGAVLATTYPLFKRITHGVVLWMAINVVWVLIYDTEYAMADRQDDLKVGVKSTALWLGRWDIGAIAGWMVLMLLLLAVAGSLGRTDGLWWLSVAVVAALFARQLWMIRGRDPQACFQAFLFNHWVGLVIFLGIASQLI